MSREKHYYIDENNMFHRTEENDGYAFMRKGAQRSDEILCEVKHLPVMYPHLVSKLNEILGGPDAIRQQTKTV